MVNIIYIDRYLFKNYVYNIFGDGYIYKTRIYEQVQSDDIKFDEMIRLYKHKDNYYKLLETSCLDLNSKMNIVKKYLKKINIEGWKKGAVKNKNDICVQEKEINTLTNFVLLDNDVNDEILTKSKINAFYRFIYKEIKKNNSHKAEVGFKTTLENIKKKIKENRHTPNTYTNGYKRWLKTKSYKLNQIFMTLSKEYIGNWSVVDLDGCFEFNNQKYSVDLILTKYKIKHKFRANMDKILCILDNNVLNFYDENIECITKEVKLHEA